MLRNREDPNLILPVLPLEVERTVQTSVDETRSEVAPRVGLVSRADAVASLLRSMHAWNWSIRNQERTSRTVDELALHGWSARRVTDWIPLRSGIVDYDSDRRYAFHCSVVWHFDRQGYELDHREDRSSTLYAEQERDDWVPFDRIQSSVCVHRWFAELDPRSDRNHEPLFQTDENCPHLTSDTVLPSLNEGGNQNRSTWFWQAYLVACPGRSTSWHWWAKGMIWNNNMIDKRERWMSTNRFLYGWVDSVVVLIGGSVGFRWRLICGGARTGRGFRVDAVDGSSFSLPLGFPADCIAVVDETKLGVKLYSFTIDDGTGGFSLVSIMSSLMGLAGIFVRESVCKGTSLLAISGFSLSSSMVNEGCLTTMGGVGTRFFSFK